VGLANAASCYVLLSGTASTKKSACSWTAHFLGTHTCDIDAQKTGLQSFPRSAHMRYRYSEDGATRKPRQRGRRLLFTYERGYPPLRTDDRSRTTTPKTQRHLPSPPPPLLPAPCGHGASSLDSVRRLRHHVNPSAPRASYRRTNVGSSVRRATHSLTHPHARGCASSVRRECRNGGPSRESSQRTRYTVCDRQLDSY
jgi:hypothetical protein